MIITNQILNLSISLITNFAGVVEAPPAFVPTQVTDLERFVIGGPRAPIEVYIFGKPAER